MGKHRHQQLSLAPAQLQTIAIHVLVVILNTHDIQLQAFFLVSDDIMDNSVTRRGQPCWYRMPEVYLSRMHSCSHQLLRCLFTICSHVSATVSFVGTSLSLRLSMVLKLIKP